MLLKCCQSAPTERRSKVNENKPQRNCTGNNMKLTVGSSGALPRSQRKVVRTSNKRPSTGKRILLPAGLPEYQTADPCDSSNDSGLGLEPLPGARPMSRVWHADVVPAKRKKMVEVKLESDDANDNFTFEETIIQAKRMPLETQLLPSLARLSVPRPSASRITVRRPALTVVQRRMGPNLIAAQLLGVVRPSKPYLQILSQPEQQHRARYQTEGSRGAVKDRTGNGFPSVKLVGYEGRATLQVFIGSDLGRAVPHMFYQACRVSGKNSTPCTEKVVDGTVVIEVEFESNKENIITCDCVGILKERNVDVEHRFPEQSGPRNKKKSTRCRMVFRTIITHPDGTEETLEISSQPIVCTQPPGVPEICKKSLSSSPCIGGQELFIIGKNFLKDTRVVFSNCESQPHLPPWEVAVLPDKEYLQQSHLVCVVPPYRKLDLSEPMTVNISVTSSGKTSEPHSFTYTPQQQQQQQQQVAINEETQCSVTKVQSGCIQLSGEQHGLIGSLPAVCPKILRQMSTPYFLVQPAPGGQKESVFLWKPTPVITDCRLKKELLQTPPRLSPPPLQPIMSLTPNTLSGAVLPTITKQLTDHQKVMSTERVRSPTMASMPSDVASMNQLALSTSPVVPVPMPAETQPPTLPMLHFIPISLPMATGADLSCTQSPSLDTLRRFVSTENVDWALPALNVEKFLSGLEHKLETKLEESRKAFEDNRFIATNALHPASPKIKFEHLNSPSNHVSPIMIHPSEIKIGITKHQEDENSNSHSAPIVSPQYSNHMVNVDHEHVMLHCQQTTAIPIPNNPAPTTLCNSLASSQISAVQNARLDALVSSSMASTVNTQRLEALVNSAADCHLSSSETSFNVIPGSHFSVEMLLESKKDVQSLTTDLSNGCSLASQGSIMNGIHSPCIASQLTENIFADENQQVVCNLPLSASLANSMSPKHSETIHLVPSRYPADGFHTSPDIVPENIIAAHSSLYNSSASLVMNSNVDQEQLISADAAQLTQFVNSTLGDHLLPAVSQAVSEPAVNLCPLSGNVRTLESGCENVNNLFSGRNEASFIAEASTLNEPCCSVALGPHFSIASNGGACTTSGMHCSTSNLILSLAKEKVDTAVPPMKDLTALVNTREVQKREEGMVPRVLTQMSEMSENDLLSYINPSCFDTV